MVKYEGMYGLYHIIFLLVFLIVTSVVIYIFINKLKVSQQRAIGIRVIAIIWLSFTIAHQIVETFINIDTLPGSTWAMIIPHSYCSFLSFATPIVLIFFKKNNIALHCICYFSFFGGFSIFYPTWLNDLSFYSPLGILTTFHHAFMLGTSILLVTIEYVKPTMRRFYVFPIGFALIVLFGVFEKYALHFPDTIGGQPLLPSLPHLTSWWGLWIGSSFLVFIFLFLYEVVIYKKPAKQVFDVHNVFDTKFFKDIKKNKKK